MKSIDLKMTLERGVNKNGHETFTGTIYAVTRKGMQEIAAVTSSRDYAAITGVLAEAKTGILGKFNEIKEG